MSMPLAPAEFAGLYARFHAPLAALDCGAHCAPHNHGVPFCCDTTHTLPTAFPAEWAYLQASTDLWRMLEAGDPRPADSTGDVPAGGPELICLGHTRCQRTFRAVACRSFPFYPYVTTAGEFIGLATYWEYEDRCWILSNLDVVSDDYRNEFVAAYEVLFAAHPEEQRAWAEHAAGVRRLFGRGRRRLALLHRQGGWYWLHPRRGSLRPVEAGQFPKFGPYRADKG
jgi:hypothetical protein